MKTAKRSEPVDNCGCRLERTEKGLKMVDCPLHAAASSMLKALELIADAETRGIIQGAPGQIEAVVKVARAALATAKGQGKKAATKTDFYLLTIEGDVEPLISGPPFKTEDERDDAAREHKEKHGDDDGIFALDVVNGIPEAYSYSKGFFEEGRKGEDA